MTDNRTTELLRKLLDERGVEWWESRGYGTGIVYTFWHSPTFGRVHAIENDDGTLFMACLNNCDFTPEQAIAATLGGGTCEMEYGGDITPDTARVMDVYFCSECGSPIYNDCMPHFCIYCGKAVKR